MSESARRLRANKVLDGRACARCSTPIRLGSDAAVCTACNAPHHAVCWDRAAGCATKGCVNAPLAQMAPVVMPQAGTGDARPIPPGSKACPHCGHVHAMSRPVCPKCSRAPTPSGVYDGPKQNAPGAVASLVWGIVSIFICGIILGFVAISKSKEASAVIAKDPRYGGQGLATAGRILGIIGIVGSCIMILFRVLSL